MQLSIREAKSRFAEAAVAAANGERVVVTKHGKPFIEMIAAKPIEDVWERAKRVRKELGIETTDASWLEEFNDPAFSRRVLGLED